MVKLARRIAGQLPSDIIIGWYLAKSLKSRSIAAANSFASRVALGFSSWLRLRDSHWLAVQSTYLGRR